MGAKAVVPKTLGVVSPAGRQKNLGRARGGAEMNQIVNRT
jgi:hypothetical protein